MSTPRGFGKGRSSTRFSYTYNDLSKILNCSVGAARKHAQRGNFDPNNLLSILEFVRDRLHETDAGSLVEQDSRKLVEQIASVKKS